MKKIVVSSMILILGFLLGYVANNQTSVSTRHSNEPFSSNNISSSLNFDLDIEELDYNGIFAQTSVFKRILFAYQLANSAEIDRLESYLLKSVKSRDPFYNYNITSIFVEAYIALDPLATIKFVNSNSEFSSKNFIPHIVTSWVRDDPEAALNYFLSLKDGRLIQVLGSRLLQDPLLAKNGMSWEIAEKMGPIPELIIENARLRSLDPQEAFRDAQYLSGTVRLQQLQSSIRRWMRVNPEEALFQIGQLENTQDRSALLEQAYQQYASYNPLAALEHIRQNHANNQNLEQSVLSIYALQNIEGALPLIEEFVQRTGETNALSSLISKWVQIDPIASIAYAETLDESHKQTIFQSLSRSYQQIDPEAGLEWALNLDSKYRQITEMAIRSIRSDNVGAAERMLFSIEDPQLKQILFSGIAQHRAQGDPQSALNWLNQYTEDSSYDVALQNVFSIWSSINPKESALALDSLQNAKLDKNIISQISQNWYQAKPEEAIDWILSQPPGEGKNNALSALSSNIAQTDLNKALTLMEGLPSSIRYRTIMDIAFSSVRRNPLESENIIESLGLSEEAAKKIRNWAKKRLSITGG